MTNIDTLLSEIASRVQDVLGDNLVGIYLHGSLAMGGFNPELSDIDILVVSKNQVPPAKRESLAQAMLRLNAKAPKKGIEISVVRLGALKPFVYPTPFEFHFSPLWIDQLKNGQFDFTAEQTDPDLAAHLTTVKARGRVLYGESIDKVFPEVPDNYYRDSIEGDAKDILKHITSDPVYNILNLCRVWAYQTDHIITSKVEGAQWALKRSDAPQKQLIQQALQQYKSGLQQDWNAKSLQLFADIMGEKLALN